MNFALIARAFIVTILLSASSFALPVYWVDWISGTPGLNGSADGVIHIGSEAVQVHYEGEAGFIQTDGGVNYWNPADPYISAAVPNPPPNSDIIATYQTTLKTLTFSRPIHDLIFAIVSLDWNGYFFDREFSVESYGQGWWGDGWMQKVYTPAGQPVVWGSWEAHGVIRFEGEIQTLSWTSYKEEYWNGFTVGTYGVPDAGSSALLLLAGFGGLALLRARFRG